MKNKSQENSVSPASPSQPRLQQQSTEICFSALADGVAEPFASLSPMLSTHVPPKRWSLGMPPPGPKQPLERLLQENSSPRL